MITNKIYFCYFVLMVHLTVALAERNINGYNVNASQEVHTNFIIRSSLSPIAPLVLARYDEIRSLRLEHWTKSPNQIFNLQSGLEPGMFLIIPSDRTNYALDCDRTTNTVTFSLLAASSATQQWIFSQTGHIVNPYLRKHLAIDDVSGGLHLHTIIAEEEDVQPESKFSLFGL